jgi:hypothetical protein
MVSFGLLMLCSKTYAIHPRVRYPPRQKQRKNTKHSNRFMAVGEFGRS